MWVLVSACAPSSSTEFSATQRSSRGPVDCAHQVLSLLGEVPRRSTSRVDCTSTPWRLHQNHPSSSHQRCPHAAQRTTVNSEFLPAPPGVGRATAPSTSHAPPGDRQAAAVDEGPFWQYELRGNNGLDRHGSVLLSWPWGSAPSGSGGPSSAVGLTTLPIVTSHAESAAMLTDPMVGYWCRVGSPALTHTRTDIFGAVAILVQRRTLLSIFVVPPTARLHQGCWLCFIRVLPGLVAAPPGVRAGSSPLV